MSPAEEAEMKALNAKVWEVIPGAVPGATRYRHWTASEWGRWHELARKRWPSIRFAPSTEEIGRLFGLENREGRGVADEP